MGETFSPDLFTGTGNFTVPIALPQGRNGFQPSLNLVYSTGHGNGPCGLGWRLSLPGISRKTSKGVPIYEDESDTFLLSGAEDLVPVSGSIPGVRRYRPRTEGLFARIEFHRDADRSFWRVRTRDGLQSTYGAPGVPDDRAPIVSDPGATNPLDRIFTWHMSESRDPFGNRIVYDYARERASGGGHDGTQTYLRSIRYVDLPDDPERPFLVSVDFDYGGPEAIRPDSFSDHRAGFEIRTLRRCRRIVVTSHVGDAVPSRSYSLIYLDELVASGDRPDEDLPPNGVSLLARIRVTGHATDVSEADQELPALDFSYSRFAPYTRRFQSLRGASLPATPLSNPRLELIDLDGDGLPDFLETDGTYRYWSNLGGCRFDLPRTMRSAPAGVDLSQRGVSALDMDGDGRLELAVTRPGFPGYFSLTAEGQFDRSSFRRVDVAPPFDLADPEVRLVDLDGDGITDAVRSASEFECAFVDPATGWQRLVRRPRGAAGSFPDLSFGDPRVRLADMTGDGLTDIVLVHDRNVEYWPNLGHGRWGARVSMRDAPPLPLGYDPRRLLLGDIDGDGCADLVFVDERGLSIWINRSGNGWGREVRIPGTPRVTNGGDLRLVDLMGGGTAGVLWSDVSASGGSAPYRFLDFTGGAKPYLLDRTDNNMGATTRIAYGSSCEDYVRDRSRPATRWRTTLPMPVNVVRRVEVIDHFSAGRLVTEYAYHHGCYDGGEREYVGFGCVDVRDADTAAGAAAADGPFSGFAAQLRAPATLMRTWFELGPVGPEFGDWRELDFSNEFWDGDPSGFPRLRADRATFFQSIATRRERRDALRALRGSFLREEHFALSAIDGSGQPDRPPYSVREAIHLVRRESSPDGSAVPPVFFPFRAASRNTRWEQGDDPLTVIDFTADLDAYGQPRAKLTVGCPRGWRRFDDARDDFLAKLARTEFAQRDDDDVFLVDRTATTREFEVTSVAGGGPARVEDLFEAAMQGAVDLVLHDETRSFYDGEAFTGLPLGQIGAFGALVRGETVAMTERQVADALAGAPEPTVPPYLAGDDAVWPPFYPDGYRSATGPSAGYTLEPTSHGIDYIVQSVRHAFDFQHPSITAPVGLVLRSRDAKGQETRLAYDAFRLFPVEVAGPTGLRTTISHDYRVMQPEAVTGPAGNRTVNRYTPVGLVAAVVAMGREGSQTGDTLDEPALRFTYDLLAFETSAGDNRRPISVTTIQRIFHANGPFDDDVAPDQTVEKAEYSDGFGRLLQTRAEAATLSFGDPLLGEGAGLALDQASPGAATAATNVPDRVVVTGAVVYDSKGRVVEQFEPYFDTDLAYRAPDAAHDTRSSRMFYDPRGALVRTVAPDGSEQWTVLGVPANVSDPSSFVPTPWETYVYDANDLAPLSAPRDAAEPSATLAARAPADHHFTPSSIEIDAFGRTVRAVQRLGPQADAAITTRSRYDIRGKVLEVTDALGRPAFRYAYDLAGRIARIDSIDAGVRIDFHDAAGVTIEQRDDKGAVVLTAVDALDRPVDVWARDGTDLPVTCRQHVIYGDTAPAALLSAFDAAENGLLGQIFQHYDDGGRLTAHRYDFKGNLLDASRSVIADQVVLSAMDEPGSIEAFQVDWTPSPGQSLAELAAAMLEPTEYRTSSTYDALNRLVRTDYPEDVEHRRRQLHVRYDRAGALQGVDLDGETIVRHVAYDAKGQRTLVAYGNGVLTRYAYDPLSLRLRRLRSERYAEPSALSFVPTGPPLQDSAYRYDLVGNITEISDRTPASGILNNPDAASAETPAVAVLLASGDALVRRFEYDPLYRLTLATGREHDHPPDDPPWRDVPRTTDITRTRLYVERYAYDVAGNLEELRHVAGAGTFTQQLAFPPSAVPGIAESNRLQRMTVGGISVDYVHDDAGNVRSEGSSRSFHWDHANRLKAFRIQAGDAEPSVLAVYLYAADGQRVKKIVRRQGGAVQSTTYVPGGPERTREAGVENDVIDVSIGTVRVASLRIGPAFADDTTPARKFQLGDHLGSCNVVVDGTGAIVDREEFLPYGVTSFGSAARKRWRFAGARRDEESGLSYHGARYYAPWLARWTTHDPAGAVDGPNLFSYASNNPIRLLDPSGTFAAPPEDKGQAKPEQMKANATQGTATENAHEDSMRAAGHEPAGRNETLKSGWGGGKNDRRYPFRSHEVKNTDATTKSYRDPESNDLKLTEFRRKARRSARQASKHNEQMADRGLQVTRKDGTTMARPMKTTIFHYVQGVNSDELPLIKRTMIDESRRTANVNVVVLGEVRFGRGKFRSQAGFLDLRIIPGLSSFLSRNSGRVGVMVGAGGAAARLAVPYLAEGAALLESAGGLSTLQAYATTPVVRGAVRFGVVGLAAVAGLAIGRVTAKAAGEDEFYAGATERTFVSDAEFERRMEYANPLPIDAGWAETANDVIFSVDKFIRDIRF